MSRSSHKQRTGAKQWNPPPLSGHAPSPFPSEKNVASSTDCTGLEAQPVINEQAADSYAKLYAIHTQKTQGNIGKGNPQNDADEVGFHRT